MIWEGFLPLLGFGRVCEGLVLMFFKTLVEFTNETIWTWAFFFACVCVGSLKITNLISLFVICLFKLSSCVSFGNLKFSRNLSI